MADGITVITFSAFSPSEAPHSEVKSRPRDQNRGARYKNPPGVGGTYKINGILFMSRLLLRLAVVLVVNFVAGTLFPFQVSIAEPNCCWAAITD